MSITVIADDRERKVIPFFTTVFSFPQYKFMWEVRRMLHADYAILWNGKLVALVERKRWNDLASSIVDKRILNIENLKILRERTGCCLIVIIEGARPKRNSSKHGVSYSAMKSKLDHLIIRDHIHIDYSKNPNGTVIRLAELSRNFTTIADDMHFANSEDHSDVIEEIMGLREQCDEVINAKNKKEAIMGWCALPGVDMVTTNLIRKAGYSLTDVVMGKLSMTELAAMTYPGVNKQKIGFERAAAILKGVTESKTHIAILASVRGVSTELASSILKPFGGSLRNLLDDGTAETISSLKHKGKKIGLAISTRIMASLEATLDESSSDSD